MADALRLRLTLDGQPLPIDELNGSSVRLRGDVDVWPRETSFELALPREMDRRHFMEIMTREGWPDVTLRPDLNNGDLIYRAQNNRWLPAATCKVRLTIAGLRPSGVTTVDVADGQGEVVVQIQLTRDPRQVKLTADIRAWDAAVQGLVTRADSIIDGRQAAEWIADDQAPPQRRACILNLLAKLRTIPSVNAPLINQVEAILCVQLERVYVRVAPALDANAMFSDPNLFKREGEPKADIHKRLLLWIRSRLPEPEAQGIGFPLLSYRQAITFRSTQLVFATPDLTNLPAGLSRQPACYADVDIDLGGSLTDLVGFVRHMGELASGGITDHLDLHDGLSREPFTQNYLYYNVL